MPLTSNTTHTAAPRDPRITAEYVRKLLDYDPESGHMRWRVREPDENYDAHSCKMLNARDAGKIAGTLNTQNYVLIELLGRKYGVHQLAWLCTTGVWPDGEVDHINGDPSDNRLKNLRLVTLAQNRRNAARRKDNTSGVTGVRLDTATGKWHAYLRYNKKLLQLGRYSDFALAVEARKQAEEIYGFEAEHGKRQRLTIRTSNTGSLK